MSFCDLSPSSLEEHLEERSPRSAQGAQETTAAASGTDTQATSARPKPQKAVKNDQPLVPKLGHGGAITAK